MAVGGDLGCVADDLMNYCSCHCQGLPLSPEYKLAIVRKHNDLVECHLLVRADYYCRDEDDATDEYDTHWDHQGPDKVSY